jgi:hypothetical protein
MQQHTVHVLTLTHSIHRLGCNGAKQLQCLRALPFRNLTLEAQVSGPCAKGKMMSAQPSQLFAQGKFVKVPQLLGSNQDEGNIWAAIETRSFTQATEEQYVQAFDMCKPWGLADFGMELYRPTVKVPTQSNPHVLMLILVLIPRIDCGVYDLLLASRRPKATGKRLHKPKEV